MRTRTRTGQDKLAEIQNILHETVTGNRIVKAFNTELWEILRFKKAASACFAPTCAAFAFNRSARR